MQGCQDRSQELRKRHLMIDHNNRSIGSQVTYQCACVHQHLRGGHVATCNTNFMWEPSDMPECENDWLAPLSTRECVMLGITAGCLVVVLVLAVCTSLRQRGKNKLQTKSTKKVKEWLKSVSSKDNDPLDEVIRREVFRRESGRRPWAPQQQRTLDTASTKHCSQVFRVWNHDGSKREEIMASPTLRDLTEEVCDRFGLTSPISLVLELDGKQIRSTEELMTHSGKLLIALETGQMWRPIRGQGHLANHYDYSMSLSKDISNRYNNYDSNNTSISKNKSLTKEYPSCSNSSEQARGRKVSDSETVSSQGRSDGDDECQGRGRADQIHKAEIRPDRASNSSMVIYTVHTPDKTMTSRSEEGNSERNNTIDDVSFERLHGSDGVLW